MAGNDTSLGFNLIGRDVSASDALQKVARTAKQTGDDFDVVGKNLHGFTGSISKSFLGVGAAIGGAFAVGNIVSSFTQFLGDATSAAIEDEKSMVSLRTAMENVGLASQNAAAEDFVKSLSLATGVADDNLRPALQRLVTATGDAKRSQDLLALALDISVATGKDATTVATALGKAANGQVSALTRLGIPLDANIVKTKDFGAAVAVLSDKFGGQAAAASETYGGQLAKVKNAADEASEAVGGALLDAASNVAEVFGGTGGIVETIDAAGTSLANFITGLGLTTTAVAEFVKSTQAQDDSLSQTIANWEWLANAAGPLGPALAGIAVAYQKQADAGAEANEAARVQSDSLRASESLYAGYTATLDTNRGIQNKATLAVMDGTAALEDMQAAAKELQGVLSNSQSIDDFRKSLVDLDKTLKDNPRSFKGMGDAAKENRDVLRDELGKASQIAQKWVDDGKISADQYEAAYKGLAKKVVNQFVRDGFKRSDIEDFMGSEGIWTGPASKRLTAAEKAALALAYSGFKGVGGDMAKGLGDGLIMHSSYVSKMARQVVLEAEAAARTAAESHSPSKLFYRVGEDLGEGLKQGMEIVWPRIAGDINKGMAELTVSIRGSADEASGALLQSFSNRTDAFKSIIDSQVEKITSARQALKDYASSVTDTILGNIKFQTTGTDAEGKSVALTPEQIVQMVLGDISNQTDAVNAIGQIATKIPEALTQQMLTMDPKAAIALADYLSNNPAQVERLTWNYNGLATLTQNVLGVPMAAAFATVGDTSAVQMIASAKQKIAEEAGEFRRWVRHHLGTTITVKVNYDTSGAPNYPARAMGGPVSGGQAYWVGERGPEIFVPSGGGSIVPNGAVSRLPSSGGSPIIVNLNVNGSVMAQQDLVTTVRDGLAQGLRRRGLDPSVLGV